MSESQQAPSRATVRDENVTENAEPSKASQNTDHISPKSPIKEKAVPKSTKVGESTPSSRETTHKVTVVEQGTSERATFSKPKPVSKENPIPVPKADLPKPQAGESSSTKSQHLPPTVSEKEISQGEWTSGQRPSKRPRPRSIVDLGEDGDILLTFINSISAGEKGDQTRAKDKQEPEKGTTVAIGAHESERHKGDQEPQSQPLSKPSEPTRPATDSKSRSPETRYCSSSSRSHEEPEPGGETSSTLNEPFHWFNFVKEETEESQSSSPNLSPSSTSQGSSFSSSSRGGFKSGTWQQSGRSRTNSGWQKSQPKPEPKPYSGYPGRTGFNARTEGNSAPPRPQTFNMNSDRSHYQRQEYRSTGAHSSGTAYESYTSYQFTGHQSGQSSQTSNRTYAYYPYTHHQSEHSEKSQQQGHPYQQQRNSQYSHQNQRTNNSSYSSYSYYTTHSGSSPQNQQNHRQRQNSQRSTPQPESSLPPPKAAPILELAAFNPYITLSILRTATPVEVRHAFKKASITHHPDKAMQRGASKEAAEEKMKDLNCAKDILYDNVARYVYNQYGLQEAESAAFVESVRGSFVAVQEEMYEVMFGSGRW